MAIVKVKVWDIDWDTDGKKVSELPDEVTFEMKEDGTGISDDDIANELSDEYGYCVNAFYVEFTDQDSFVLDRFGERINEIEAKIVKLNNERRIRIMSKSKKALNYIVMVCAIISAILFFIDKDWNAFLWAIIAFMWMVYSNL